MTEGNMSIQEKTDGCSFAAEELVPVIREVLSAGGDFPLTVTGTSMTPTLRDGRDQVRLVSAAVRSAGMGEIVFFQRESGEYILHRICRELPDGKLLINGDAQNWFETIEKGQVIAVVAAICRKGKLISCDNRLYRLYVYVWSGLRPLRPCLFRIHRICKRVGRIAGKQAG